MDGQNPYQSPQASESMTDAAWSDGLAQPFELASQGKRFLNYLIDQVVLFVLINIASFALGVVLAIVAGPEVIETTPEPLFWLYGLLIAAIYYIFFEAVTGRSIGKMLTGTRVVNEDFARYIPFEPFSFLGGNKPVGWHDSLSKTRVALNR